jgi:dTDP-glucose 4,6-dehydratase
MRLLVTGGAGFIGSHFIGHILDKYPKYHVINLDKLTYAGNLENLKAVEKNPRYRFVKGDICDSEVVEALAKNVDVILNFAAETHVDRSLMNPGEFIQTDVFGTHVLLEASKRHQHQRYIQISTDEVYGSIDKGAFKESDPLSPSSPYAASKAGGDHMVFSYWITYKLPVVISRCSNNFGPNQYPEKLIPLFITNALEDKPLPLYGDGLNVRDWIFVKDHCEAVDLILHKGKPGEIYNIAGENERTNKEITKLILENLKKPSSLIQNVTDRLGHDRRYAINSEKISRLGFKPRYNFEDGLLETVKWYCENKDWWKPIKSGEFRTYYEKQYLERRTKN